MSDADGFAIEPRPCSSAGHEQVFFEGVENHCGLNPAASLVSDRDTELRVAMGKVGGTVERIDYPSVLARGLGAAALFRQYGVIGIGALHHVNYSRLGFVVGLGN